MLTKGRKRLLGAVGLLIVAEILSWLASLSETFSSYVEHGSQNPEYYHCAVNGSVIWCETVNFFVWIGDHSSVVATVLIALFTGTLWWSTRSLWRASENQLRVSRRTAIANIAAARATAKSADSLRVTERAYLFAGPLGEIKTTEFGKLALDLDIVNYGKTPGILRDMRVIFSEDCPEAPFYVGGHLLTTDVVLASGEHIKQNKHSRFHSSFSRSHFAYGYITYLDIFRDRHTTRFCLLIRPDGTFEIRGPREMNEWD